MSADSPSVGKSINQPELAEVIADRFQCLLDPFLTSTCQEYIMKHEDKAPLARKKWRKTNKNSLLRCKSAQEIRDWAKAFFVLHAECVLVTWLSRLLQLSACQSERVLKLYECAVATQDLPCFVRIVHVAGLPLSGRRGAGPFGHTAAKILLL